MLGRSLCRRLAGRNQILGISKSGREGTNACDISSREQLDLCFKALKPDLVINTAAYSDVDGCEKDPALAHATNAAAVKNISDFCGRSGAALVHISTDYVFDGLKSSPYTEEDNTSPVNIYGLTKLEGEYYAVRCQSATAVVRSSWLFGSGNDANFVNIIAQRLRSERIVSVLDDQTDAPTYIEDLSDAVERIALGLLQPRPIGNAAQVYHVCNSGSATRHQMAVAMKDILGLKDVEVQKAERSSIKGRMAVRPAYAVMSSLRFERTFGVRLRPWQDSLKEYLLN